MAHCKDKFLVQTEVLGAGEEIGADTFKKSEVGLVLREGFEVTWLRLVAYCRRAHGQLAAACRCLASLANAGARRPSTNPHRA